MISAVNWPAQNFSRTTSGSRPLASWQLDLSSLSPSLSSANAGVVRTMRLTMVSTVSPQRLGRDHCISYSSCQGLIFPLWQTLLIHNRCASFTPSPRRAPVRVGAAVHKVSLQSRQSYGLALYSLKNPLLTTERLSPMIMTNPVPLHGVGVFTPHSSGRSDAQALSWSYHLAGIAPALALAEFREAVLAIVHRPAGTAAGQGDPHRRRAVYPGSVRLRARFSLSLFRHAG